MLGPIPERGYQIPEFGRTDEIQDCLHGSAKADDPFGVMGTIVDCQELLCVKTPANCTEVTCILMIIWKSDRLCRHWSLPFCCLRDFSSLPLAPALMTERSTAVQVLPGCEDFPRTL